MNMHDLFYSETILVTRVFPSFFVRYYVVGHPERRKRYVEALANGHHGESAKNYALARSLAREKAPDRREGRRMFPCTAPLHDFWTDKLLEG